jgi:separase
LTREEALFKVVQRTTKLATFELLLPGQDSSLLKRLHSAGYSVSTIAAVIELQIASLERNLDQLEALNAITGLLHDLLVLYDPVNFPMRRSRYVPVVPPPQQR